MADTLRYFFSAVFQGFAAIITLGAMYFLFFFEKIENQKKDIVEKLKPFEHYESGYQDFIMLNGIVEYVKQMVLPKKVNVQQYDTTRALINNYDSLIKTKLKIENYLPLILKGTISILILSIISLFLVGYNIYLDYFLILIGLIIIFLSIKYLFLIKKVILEIIFNR